VFAAFSIKLVDGCTSIGECDGGDTEQLTCDKLDCWVVDDAEDYNKPARIYKQIAIKFLPQLMWILDLV